jgi:hypothetical protein
LLAPGVALGGWLDDHFDDANGYSRLHYWLPGIYRFRAYHRPVVFDTPAAPYPPTPVGAQAYPFRDLPMPIPTEIPGRDAPPPIVPPANGQVAPIAPPVRPIDPGK